MNLSAESLVASRLATIAFVTLVVVAGGAAILWITGFFSSPPNPGSSINSDILFQTCLDKAYQSTDRPSSTFANDRAQYDEKQPLQCYQQVSTKLLFRNVEARYESYQTSQQQGFRMNLIAMIILLFATTSGILLAGLQMWASFTLMSQGYQRINQNMELVLKYNSVALRSSTIGVSIFAISMIFFSVFVFFTHQITITQSFPEAPANPVLSQNGS